MPTLAAALPVDYDIVYVRAPRYGNDQNSLWPDTARPLTPDPGATLMLLHPDGGEELLFPRPEHAALVDGPVGSGSVADPNVSFDAHRVVFTYHHDRTDVNSQRGSGDASLSYEGSDIFVIDLTTRVVQRLTWQEFTPNTGNGADFDCSRSNTNCPRVGVFNSGPAWLSDGRIAFTSSRNNLVPPQTFNSGQRTLQLFVMDADGRNAEQIGYLNQAMALHPYQLQDGRIAFSSWEGQGLRDLRQFPLWVIRPDGTQWMSLSGFSERAIVHHFMTQMRNGDIVVTRYYNLNNNGFGDLIRYPIDPSGPDFLPIDGPGAGDYPLERKGVVRLTPFTTQEDFPAPCPGQEDNPYGSATNPSCAPAQRRGKFTQPAAAPNDDLLVVYSPGPCNHNGVWDSQDHPYYDGGIYVIPGGQPISSPSALVLVKNDPNYNEQWPRPVVPYLRIHGLDKPAVLPSVRNAGSEHNLAPGTPFGLIGTASLIWRDTHAGPGPAWLPPDPFNYTHEFLYDWTAQGTDAGRYTDDDIWAVRILAMEPLTDRSYPDNGLGFGTVGTERLRILGEIPVRKPGDPQVLHPDGVMRADTSFLAQVPADTPITFQTLDRNAMVLNMAETWHQVRPGEARYDCGGCHAHSKDPLDFHRTAAGQPDFVPTDLTRAASLLAHDAQGSPIVVQTAAKTVDVEYVRDVQPILQRRCVTCHAGATPAGQLDLNADARSEWVPWQNWPGTYFRLVLDSNSRYGLPPPTGTTWFAPQLTRYMRGFQSRQSLLMWKVWGARLDGRTNADRDDDIDFASTASHPAGVGVPGMPDSEKLTIARWIDLGAPIELDPSRGFFEDDLRPTLALQPSRGDAAAAGQLTTLRVGTYDLESGIDPTSLVVMLDVPVGTIAAGANLARDVAPADGGVVPIALPAALSLAGREVRAHVSVRDRAGHVTALDRVYAAAAIGGTTPTFTPTPTRTPLPATASTTATGTATRTAVRTATQTPTAPAVTPTRTAAASATRTASATVTRTPTATVSATRSTSAGARTPRRLPDSTTGIHVFNDQLSGLSPGRIAFAASHYDGTQKMTRADADALRAANPDFVILHYRLGHGLGYRVPGAGCSPAGGFLQIINGTWIQEWPGDASVQESWFFHQNTQRVYQCTFGWFLMELDDAGWRQWWSDAVLAQMAANDDDGLFADSLSVPNYLGASDFSPALPPVDAAFESAWAGRIGRFLGYLQGRFAGRYYLIPNAGFWVTTRDPTDYSAADGVMIEGFGYDVWTAFGAGDWALQIDRVLGLVNRGKALIAQAYHTESADTRLFTLASYLLVKANHTYVNLDTGLNPEWWPEYGIPIGAPSGAAPANAAALLDAGTGVYQRAYSNGLVLVNPGDAARTVPLGATYYLAQPSGGGTVPTDGVLPAAWTVAYAPVSSVTVGPGHAAILVRDPNGPVPPTQPAATRTPVRTATPTVLPMLVLNPLSGPIVVGGTMTLTGQGFTAGSVVVLFVSIGGGVQAYGPFTPTSRTATSLVWAIPATIPLGNGFATVQVVNTDQGYITSNTRGQLVYGAPAAGLPTITAIDGVALSPPNPAVPLANVSAVIRPGSSVTITGTGFSSPVVALYSSNPTAAALEPEAGGASTQARVTIPSDLPVGPGSFQVLNRPAFKSSNLVAVVIGEPIRIDRVTQSGTTITVTGAGFSPRTVISFFNGHPGGVVNLGGLVNGTQSLIPLHVVSAAEFTFQIPAGALSGPSYVQALNPPFMPFSSSGSDAGGAFTLLVP